MSKKKTEVDLKAVKQEIKIQKGNDAEKLLESKEWKEIKALLDSQVDKNTELCTDGVTPKYEDGILVKTGEQVYWEMIGEIRAFRSIEKLYQGRIEKRDRILKKLKQKNEDT